MSLRVYSTGLAMVAALTLGLSGCAASTAGDGSAADSVTLIVHDSFPNEEFAAAASEATGYDVKVVTAGDGGELTSQLVLTKGAPVADAFFGVDNVFASRLLDDEVVVPFVPSNALPQRASDIAREFVSVSDNGDAAGEGGYSLLPVTLGATCINIDPAWFAENNLAEPESYEDLIDEQYRGLTVLLDPSTSTTGASFLIGTIAQFGESGFAEYWTQLAENEVRIEQGWTEAYNGQFTQGGGDGTHPIVLSYSSSPAWTVTEDGTATTTEALLDTCSSQIEFAGVLAGAQNPQGAQAVVEYLLSREFQDTVADSMYVYPVDEGAHLPAQWQQFAPLPTAPNDVSAVEIGQKRDTWLKQWSDATGW